MRNRVLALFATAVSVTAVGQPIDQVWAPELNEDSWVMIEIWPEAHAITLTAFFLDNSFEKNRNLCAATKRVFDREQEYKSKESFKSLTSYRMCLSVEEADKRGYFK